jgi:hypothetical protein
MADPVTPTVEDPSIIQVSSACCGEVFLCRGSSGHFSYANSTVVIESSIILLGNRMLRRARAH